MASKILKTRQKIKNDTSTNWNTNNPILLAGEIGFDSTRNIFKIGDGINKWNSINTYFSSTAYLTISQYNSLTTAEKNHSDTLYVIIDTNKQIVDIYVNNKSFKTTIYNDNLTTISKTLSISAQEWTSTGISMKDFSAGTYILQVQYNGEIYSGIMPWNGNSALVTSEIILQGSYLTDSSLANTYLSLEIGLNIYITSYKDITNGVFTFKFKKII